MSLPPDGRLRAVTLELSQADLTTFDPEATVAMLAGEGFNTIVCFAVGYARGEAYFPSAHAPEHPDLHGRDLVGEVVDAAHARGMTVWGYVNSFFGGPELFEAHPDWVQRRRDGSPTAQGEARAMCPLSPYGDHIVAVCTEVARRYPLEGFYLDEPSFQSWCRCSFCVERYREDTGREVPGEPGFGERDFARWLDWRADRIAEFVARVGDAVRAALPGATYVAQHAFPLSTNALPDGGRAAWGLEEAPRVPAEFESVYRPTFYAQDIVKESKALDLVALEPWRHFVGTPTWWEGMCVSYARSAGRGKPVLPLMEYPHFPWPEARLSATELAANAADVVASGGAGIWYPMYAPGAADVSGWRDLGEIIAELDRAPASGTPWGHVGVVVSRRTAERFGGQDADARYLDDLLGAVAVVRELGLPYVVLSLEAAEEDELDACAALLLPSAACPSDREAARLAGYVERGGGLVAWGPTGICDEDGVERPERALDALLGIAADGHVDAGLGYVRVEDERLGSVGARVPVRGSQPRLAPLDAAVLASLEPSFAIFAAPRERANAPSITAVRRGTGAAVHAALPLGQIRTRNGAHEVTPLVDALIRLAQRAPSPVRLHAGADVALHAWRSGAELVLWLVNHTGVLEHGHVTSVGPVRVEVGGAVAAAAATRGECATVTEDGRAWLEVPTVGPWECIRLRVI